MSDDFCYVHGHEPLPEKYYRLCIECGHCFVTEQELAQKDLSIRVELWYVHDGKEENKPVLKSGEEIHICPECSHDF